jgi:hypothetical protein
MKKGERPYPWKIYQIHGIREIKIPTLGVLGQLLNQIHYANSISTSLTALGGADDAAISLSQVYLLPT